MSSGGRTVWQAQDAAWWRRERIVELGEEFGPAGPAVANWLECEAKAQNDGGRVKAGYRAIARGAFLPGGPEDAERIVSYAVEIGFLKEFEEGTRTFTASISAYKADQARAFSAARKAAQRAAAPAETDEPPRDTGGQDGTDRDKAGQTWTDPSMSHPVPECPTTGENRTGEERTAELLEQQERRASAPGSRSRRLKPVTYRHQKVPPDTVDTAHRLLDVYCETTGRKIGHLDARGSPSPDLKQVIGALLARPAVEEAEWVAGIRATAERPHSWVDGRPLKVGDVFGEKAADHTLAAGRAGPAVVPGRRFERGSGTGIRSGDFLALLDEHGNLRDDDGRNTA
jgi:hypothetical protein